MRIRIVTLVAALLLAGCGTATSGSAPPQSSPASASATSSSPAPTTASPTPSPDPYAEYLRLNPDSSLVLSRQDAAARAYLGCGQKWPPGTIDAVLQQVYAAYCPK